VAPANRSFYIYIVPFSQEGRQASTLVGRFYDPLTALQVLHFTQKAVGVGEAAVIVEQGYPLESNIHTQLRLEAELEPFFEWIRNNRKEREED